MQTNKEKIAIFHRRRMQDGKNVYQGKLFPVTEGETAAADSE